VRPSKVLRCMTLRADTADAQMQRARKHDRRASLVTYRSAAGVRCRRACWRVRSDARAPIAFAAVCVPLVSWQFAVAQERAMYGRA
jgi:hypothetical protein